MAQGSDPIVHRLAHATSTQRVARDYVDLGAARAGHVVVAEEQTEGKGRCGRTWFSPAGGLYATFIVPHAPLIAARAGIAVARTLEALSIPVRLKWPNDLLADGRKLGGILIETAKTLALVGVGLNIETSPLPEAASLSDFGVVADRLRLVREIYFGLVKPATHAEILQNYRSRLDTPGRRVRVERGEGSSPPMVGTAVDVDDEGRLLIETAEGLLVVTSGDCIHLRLA
jgi:BirA family biotin operon repressor/biotin-[acetyl-CoA-carboxylase] ligase